MGATDTITLNRILASAAGFQASDLHLVIGSQPTVRVNGQLRFLQDEQIISPEFMTEISKLLLTETQLQLLASQREITAAINYNPQIRFKVSAVFQRGALAVSLHFIPARIPRLEELNLPAAVQTFPTMTKGLLVFTGPFGSGKTTTMNAIVNAINETRAASIITIEQPIEYLFVNNKSLIEQREVGRDALTIEQAVIAASREDVDVIVVSETTSPAVLGVLLDAAAASRLVMTTMTTDTVLATVDKLLNSFPSAEMSKIRVQISNVLAGIVSQRLVPRIGGGQVAVAEVMIPTPPVRAVIRDGALNQLSNVLTTSRESGLISVDRALAQLVKNGIVSPEDGVAHAADPVNFQRLTV